MSEQQTQTKEVIPCLREAVIKLVPAIFVVIVDYRWYSA